MGEVGTESQGWREAVGTATRTAVNKSRDKLGWTALTALRGCSSQEKQDWEELSRLQMSGRGIEGEVAKLLDGQKGRGVELEAGAEVQLQLRVAKN